MFTDKKYLIFDLDGTLVESNQKSEAIVLGHLFSIPWINRELAKSIFESTLGTPLLRQLEIICEWLPLDKKIICNKIYSDIFELDCNFFPGVPQKIRELSNIFTLFLTTGNSTPTALKYLKKWEIEDCFSLILGSESILKWSEHLESFRNSSRDPYFYEHSVYIWDGESDRRFALEKGIDFIHIGTEWKDQYELSSVSLIDTKALIKD